MRNGIMGLMDLLAGNDWLEALGRLRHGRTEGAKGHRYGHRPRTVIGSFGRVVCRWRARVCGEDGRSREFHSTLLPRYKRLTGSAHALIAGAGQGNTRRVRLALGRLFGGAVSKDTVSLSQNTTFKLD